MKILNCWNETTHVLFKQSFYLKFLGGQDLIGFQWWPATLWSGCQCSQQTESVKVRRKTQSVRNYPSCNSNADICMSWYPSYLQDCHHVTSGIKVNQNNHRDLMSILGRGTNNCRVGRRTCPSADHAKQRQCGGSALLFVLITSCLSSSTMTLPSRSLMPESRKRSKGINDCSK